MSYLLESTTQSDAIATWGSVDERFAITFTTIGAGNVASVAFAMGGSAGPPTGIRIAFWNDNSGTPNSVIALSSTLSFTGAATRRTFTFLSPAPVGATTTYWVGGYLAELAGGTVTNAGDGGGAGSLVDKYSTNAGASWSAAQAWEMNYAFEVTEAAAAVEKGASRLLILGVG